jgi:diguanylate cyclase
LEILERLRGMGVGITIDDFGTGYSSLAYLKRLPVNDLKIDRSFVMDMASDESARVIVHSTIDLAHNLGMRVIAEGVEDAETWSMLQELGCDQMQGFYACRALPAAEFRLWLDTRLGRTATAA